MFKSVEHKEIVTIFIVIVAVHILNLKNLSVEFLSKISLSHLLFSIQYIFLRLFSALPNHIDYHNANLEALRRTV